MFDKQREENNKRIHQQMLEDGFTDVLPFLPGVYFIVFYKHDGYMDLSEDYPITGCHSFWSNRNVTAGYTYFKKGEGLVLRFASHYNPEPEFALTPAGLEKIKVKWGTDNVYFKLIEEITKPYTPISK
jgi:hypothetical protein